MSVDALRWAMRVEGVAATGKLVLIMLGDYANEAGVSYPRQVTLAKRVGLSRETVGRLLKGLEDAGFVSETEAPAKVKARAKRGRFPVKAYKLHLDRVRVTARDSAAAEPSPCDETSHGPCDKTSHGEQAPPCEIPSHGPCDELSHGERPPCDEISHVRVTKSHTDHVTNSHVAIRSELQGSELQRGTEEKKKTALLVRRRRPTDEELDELQQAVNGALGLSGKFRLPPNRRHWEAIWSGCGGEVTEAVQVALFQAARCRPLGHPVMLDVLAGRYDSLRSGAFQAEDPRLQPPTAEEREAQLRQEMLGNA